jgi:hypothetical protein
MHYNDPTLKNLWANTDKCLFITSNFSWKQKINLLQIIYISVRQLNFTDLFPSPLITGAPVKDNNEVQLTQLLPNTYLLPGNRVHQYMNVNTPHPATFATHNQKYLSAKKHNKYYTAALIYLTFIPYLRIIISSFVT